MRYKFVFEGQVFETESPTITGLLVKNIVGFPMGYQLFMEAPGEAADEQVRDEQIIDLSRPGQIVRLFAVPPAVFGFACSR